MTIRCARAEFRLRPDSTCMQAVGFFLAKALLACSGIKVVAAVQMSNHIHLVLQDQVSELSNFMCRLIGPLAKTLNALHGYRGQVFERRFSAIPILDEAALMDRIVYTVLNPVTAGLVERPEEWPGLLLWPGGPRSGTFERDRIRRGRVTTESFELNLSTELVTAAQVDGLRREVSARVAVEKAKRQTPVLGAEQVQTEDVFAAPKHPKRSRMPLCHASSLETWTRFKDSWRAFVDAYRAASAAFRQGNWSVSFPDHCFRPWVPLPAAWPSS